MMELQRAGVSVEPTERTRAARLRHQDLLDPAPALGHRSGVAARTAVVAFGADTDEVRPAVAPALPQQPVGPRAVAPRVARRLGLQPVALQPVPDRSRAQ